MQLWDKLTPEERRIYIESRLTPGQVLLLHCDFTNPPKNKFLVLASIDPEPLFFVINSVVNEYIRRKDALAKCQVEIPHKEHPFLRHDSYIDCTAAQRVGRREIYEQLEGDINKLIGDVNPKTKEQIIAAVKFSKTLSAKHKSEILSAFKIANG